MRVFRRGVIACGLCWAALAGLAPPATAQGHDHSAAPADSSHRHAVPDSTAGPPVHDMSHMEGMEMGTMDHQSGEPGGSMSHGHTHGGMSAMYGPYPFTREASGTSWQPDRALHHGIHAMKSSWMFMLHGFADLVYDEQGGARGADKGFSGNMLMGMAQRSLGPGRLGFRTMLSIEPATIGKKGYPLLLQTGETADGRTPLIDRQHPHDLFMELAATYSVSRGDRSIFFYAGLPGEPALGPPAFMHRFSGMAFPQAPITHHWLDSSHITFGVLTGGVVVGPAKFEASAFRGREPDENRYDIESPKYDSHSFRISVNPTPGWSFQASRGRLTSPEALEPDVDVDRTTISAIHACDWVRGHWESTVAWGRNRNRPGATLDAVTAESALQLDGRHTIFARAEHVEKNELFPVGDPRDGLTFKVGELSAGYRYDFWRREHVATGVGVVGTVSLVPESIQDVYGNSPTSGMVFLRATIR